MYHCFYSLIPFQILMLFSDFYFKNKQIFVIQKHKLKGKFLPFLYIQYYKGNQSEFATLACLGF